MDILEIISIKRNLAYFGVWHTYIWAILVKYNSPPGPYYPKTNFIKIFIHAATWIHLVNAKKLNP